MVLIRTSSAHKTLAELSGQPTQPVLESHSNWFHPRRKDFIQVDGYVLGASCPAWLPPLCSARAPLDCQEYPNPSVPRFPPAFLQIHPCW